MLINGNCYLERLSLKWYHSLRHPVEKEILRSGGSLPYQLYPTYPETQERYSHIKGSKPVKNKNKKQTKNSKE